MKNIQTRLKPVINLVKKHGLIIFISITAGVYGYIIVTSSEIVAEEPSQHRINESFSGTKSPKLDSTIANKLNELEDRNINFQAIINEARQNPFGQ